MSNDDWIEWHGGECPVDRNVRADIRLSNGDTETGVLARSFFWGRAYLGSDIIAYRLHEPTITITDENGETRPITKTEVETARKLAKQPRYTNKDGRDLIDKWADEYDAEQFDLIMWTVMERYRTRLGRKDARLDEIRKIADYANRWLAVEEGRV